MVLQLIVDRNGFGTYQ